MMKKYVTFFLTLITVMSSLTACTQEEENQEAKRLKISIASIIEIQPITELREGFKEYLNKSDISKQKKISYSEYNAQGDSGIINQIVDKISVEKPDVVYALGTPIAQAIQKRAPDILLVQGAATDPVSAGLAKSWEKSGKNYIATSDLPPIEKQLELIQKLTPSVKNIGLIYNPGEVNSVAVIKRIKDYINSNELNLNLVERSISNTSEISRSLDSLIGNVDAIYLPPDNTAHAGIPLIGKFAKENKIPFYATTENAMDSHALATLSLDFRSLGKESAKLTIEVLKGKQKAQEMAIKLTDSPIIYINKSIAKELKIDLKDFESKNPDLKFSVK